MSDLFQKTEIEGCFVFKSSMFQDQRGSFSKVYSEKVFKQMGLSMPVAEVFFSVSNKDVLRGMHFQNPPYDQVKIVSCLQGKILDVVLDIRKNSFTYGKCLNWNLSSESEMTLVVPKGCAHGFYSLEDNSIVSYVVETDHDKVADQGVLWNSFGFEWPSKAPILSERDQKFPAFNQLKTLF